MPKDENLITAEILAYIRAVGGLESDWFVAAAASARECLFERHEVVREEDRWLYRKAFDEETAARVVRYFRNELGTDGRDCGGEQGNVPRTYVIAYRKSGNTTP
jgi:hypothetical protein